MNVLFSRLPGKRMDIIEEDYRVWLYSAHYEDDIELSPDG
jgi:hypothetical protein